MDTMFQAQSYITNPVMDMGMDTMFQAQSHNTNPVMNMEMDMVILEIFVYEQLDQKVA